MSDLEVSATGKTISSTSDIQVEWVAAIGKGDNVSYSDRLVYGQAQAKNILLKYVPDFSLDPATYSAAMDEVESWASRNQSQLADAIDSGVESVVEAIRLNLGSDKAQAYVLGMYTIAAAGLGPWIDGTVVEYALAAPGDPRYTLSKPINTEWCNEDAKHRLLVFSSIVRMDRDGELTRVFQPTVGTAGLGLLPLIYVIAIAFVVSVAVISYFVYQGYKTKLNNDLMKELCLNEQKKGNQAAVTQCIKAAEGLQQGVGEKAAASFSTALMWVGIAAVAVVLLGPQLQKGRRGSA